MISFIKGSSFEGIKKKLVALYILNVTDIIFTLILLNTGFYIEANIFMSKVVQNAVSSILLKAILPAALLLYIYIRIQDAGQKQLKYSNYIINAALVIYILINLSHVLWLSLIPLFLFLV